MREAGEFRGRKWQPARAVRARSLAVALVLYLVSGGTAGSLRAQLAENPSVQPAPEIGPGPGAAPAPSARPEPPARPESGRSSPLIEEDLLRTLSGGNPARLSVPLRILALLTVLTLVPSIVLLATCFPRIVIVLSFVRRAIGTQELPPNQVLIGLSIFLTAMIMAPVWEEIQRTALVPYQANQIGDEEAAARALAPLKKFMVERTLRSDLRLFVELSGYAGEAEKRAAAAGSEPLSSLPITVVAPAFILSELKTAFQMGFVLYLPFVIIDLLISTALISMGMLVLPPILISLPLKVLVFVLVDGWRLVVQELVRSFV
jgi:flagellar biosynthetic protein FliP